MHKWTFFRAGGFDQVVLATGADLANIGKLDQKLWVALSCPTKGLEFDQKTLELIDVDKDGRIRVPELVAAIAWASARLVSLDGLTLGASELPLDRIDTRSAEGRSVLASANRVLADLGKAGAQTISVDDTTDTVRIFAETSFNGDGIVTQATASDDETRKVIEEIGTCLGTLTDRSGQPGVDKLKVDTFFADARAHSDWWTKSETDTTILPLGEATLAAFTAFAAVRVKVEDFFTRARLAAFDGRATGALNRQESDYVAFAGKELSATSPELLALPLAHVEPDASLPLATGVNPAWAALVDAFRAATVTPLLGERDRITAAEWAAIVAKLAPFEAWSASPAGASVQALGLPRLRAILASDVLARIDALIVQDLALEPEASAIAAVDQLVRYHRDLFRLCNNFVSFRDFYARQKSVFQAGTLYLDQRSCDLCLRVEDVGKHSALAGASRAYLAYCECVRKATGDKITIVAAFTGGDSDNLTVGRNGVFYDRQGRDWDATITKIVDNPISLRQAFWAPYKKGLKFIEDQVAAFAASKDKGVEDAAQAGVTGAAQTAAAGAPPQTPAAQAFDIAKFAGVFAAIGLAVGAVGGALATMAAAFVSLEWWQMPLAIGGIMTAISGPSILIASLKLRQRNLGPLLDASGWAVNARAKINIPFGESLTGIAALPAGATRTARDPYAERHGTRNAMVLTGLVFVVVMTSWFFGALNPWLTFLPKSSYVLQREEAAAAPAAPPVAPAAEVVPAPAP